MADNILDFNLAKKQGEILQADISADKIRDRLNASAENFVQWLFSGRALISRGEARVGDVNGTPGASLKISLTGPDAGLWKDHATEEGGDLISLYRANMGYVGTGDFVLSLKEIARDFLGDAVEIERPTWRPTPAEKIEAAKAKLGTKPRADMLELGAPVATYKYFDTRGNVIAAVTRFEPDGTRASKTFRPWCFKTVEGVTKWVKGAPDLRPLYRLPEVSLASAVVLVEGEGKAEALHSVGIAATTAMQGANAPIEKTDWSPLAGKTVTIWPDNDDKGLIYAKNVSVKLVSIGCMVKLVSIPAGKRLKWDAGDCVADGEDASAVLATAVEVTRPPSPSPISLRSAFPIREGDIPPRDWIIPGLLLKKNLSVLVAPPGSGKSLLTLQLAILVTAGLMWGGWTPRKPEKVLIINAEDDLDEMQRRLCMAAKEMGVDQDNLKDRLYLADDPESIVIAKMDGRTKSVIRTPLIENLIKTIQDVGIGLVVVDPFAETFEGDENSNSEVKWAGILWREVARRTGCALLLVHHTKKYAGDMAGNADASRGGGALIGTARILVTLFAMTEEEGEVMEVPAEQWDDYVRFDDAKANHNKKGVVRWFKKKSATLNNAREDVPGDDVGVLVPWKPPGLMDGIAMTQLTLVWNNIDRGVPGDDGKPSGSFYTMSTQSRDRWVGNVLVSLLHCSEDKAKTIIKKWLDNGIIESFEYNDAAQRKPRTGVRCIVKNRPDFSVKNG